MERWQYSECNRKIIGFITLIKLNGERVKNRKYD